MLARGGARQAGAGQRAEGLGLDHDVLRRAEGLGVVSGWGGAVRVGIGGRAEPRAEGEPFDYVGTIQYI